MSADRQDATGLVFYFQKTGLSKKQIEADKRFQIHRRCRAKIRAAIESRKADPNAGFRLSAGSQEKAAQRLRDWKVAKQAATRQATHGKRSKYVW